MILKILIKFTIWGLVLIVFSFLLMIGYTLYKHLNQLNEAQQHVTKVNIKLIQRALEKHYEDTDTYPVTSKGLVALFERPREENISNNRNGSYFRRNKIPRDGWDQAFHYTSDGKQYEILSYGADGVLGGEGFNKDIRSTDLK